MKLRVSRCSVKMRILLVAPLRVADDLAQLFEFGILAAFIDRAREIEQVAHLDALGLKLAEGDADDTRHRGKFGGLVFLKAVLCLLFVGGLVLFDVADAKPLLKRQELRGSQAAGVDILDQSVELHQSALKRPHHGVCRAGEAALKDAHRQTRGGAI
jgi:hypothetical protein